MDYNLLKPLSVLLDERNVSRAAEKLQLTQSAASRILAKCRDAFSDPLLVRSGKEYQLTTRAEELRTEINSLLIQMQQLTQQAHFEPANVEQAVVVSGTDLDVILLRKQISDIQRLAPGLTLNIRTSTPQVVDDLLASKVDFALTAFEDQRSGLYRRLVIREPFVAVVGPNFHLASKKTISLKQYLNARHGRFSFEQPTQGRVDDALKLMGKERKISLSLPTFSQIPPFLQTSDLVFSVPESFAIYLQKHFSIRILKLPFSVEPIDVYLYWHQRQHKSELHQWIRGMLLNDSV